MKSVFIVVDKSRETAGHGDTENVNKLATYGGWTENLYPAFLSIEDAEQFIKTVSEFHSPQIMEVPVYDPVQLRIKDFV